MLTILSIWCALASIGVYYPIWKIQSALKWTAYKPSFDGDSPEGVSLTTHEIQCAFADKIWKEIPGKAWEPVWLHHLEYRYRPLPES